MNTPFLFLPSPQIDINTEFFTGSAGTGKSFLLKRIVGALPPDVTFVTASTGVAACQIGGTTLHAFAGKNNFLTPHSLNETISDPLPLEC